MITSPGARSHSPVLRHRFAAMPIAEALMRNPLAYAESLRRSATRFEKTAVLNSSAPGRIYARRLSILHVDAAAATERCIQQDRLDNVLLLQRVGV
jgi:hypothetical protein